jgi:hypothetical protein
VDEQPASVIALNATEEALLRHLANATITTVSEAYDAIGAHAAIGDKAKTKLRQLGMITASPSTVHGRRGGRAIVLQLTNAGYERIGTKPARRSRGGGAQSEFNIQRLHQLLPGSSIEVDLDGKAPDLLLRFDAVQHQEFLLALNEHGHAMNGNTPTIPHNNLAAIEVEVSDYAKTVPNNLVKDRAAGLQHILFAVMPKDEQRVITHLISLEQDLDGIIVINALRLLDTLRQKGTTT